jgi:hypothetical protein
MNLRRVCSAAVLGMSLLLASGSFAAEKASVKIYDPVMVGGKTLTAGDYTLQWEGTGSNVELNFLRGKTVIATAPARVVELAKPAIGSGTTTTEASNGGRALAEIHFRAKKMSLELGEPQSAAVK